MIDPAAVPMALLCAVLFVGIIGFHTWDYWSKRKHKKGHHK
ncbi:hypothetical protein [Endozoicomonas sp. ALE010]